MADLDEKIIREVIEIGSRDFLHYGAFHCFRKQHYNKKCDKGCRKRKAFIRIWKKLRLQIGAKNIQSWSI